MNSLSEISKTFEGLSDFFFITDERGTIVFCDENVLKFTRKGKAKYVDSKISDVYTNFSFSSSLLKSISESGSWNKSLSISLGPAGELNLNVRIKPYQPAEAGPQFFVVLNSQLREAGGINGSARDVESKLNRIISNINEFLWSAAIENGNETVFYTENIKKITGFTGDEVAGMPGRGMSLVYKDDLPALKKLMNDFYNAPHQDSIEVMYRIIRKDGKVIWIKEYIIVERDENGKVTTADGIVSDINKLKEIEFALRNSEANLKQINAAKDRFIAILSHDLRAPFTSILGFAEILLNENNLTDAERIEYLTYIYDSSQHQLQLINYLLDWSRLQTGRIKLEPKRQQAQELVFRCVSSLTGNAIRKNIDIKVNVPESIYVQADERLLTQAVTNLISNAIKFSSENSTVEVYAAVFNETQIEFVVKDSGIGIPDSNKNRLFKIDKMFSTEGTKGEKGTGLGLSLVKEIIEKHDCDIWFYSEFGKGSEFHFTLPVSTNTILLVEDNSADRAFFQRIIKKHYPDFKIIEAQNGYEALNIIMNSAPNLIITDHEMPLMNGIQLIESMQKDEYGMKIPVIAVATSLPDEIKSAYQNLGIKTILKKPVSVKDFSESLRQVLS